MEMKKGILLFVVFVLLFALFSGCTQNVDVGGDTSKVELLNYDVKTTWITGAWTLNRQEHEGNGFIHNVGSDVSGESYVITGTVKNIAGEMLNSVEITAKFYDSNDNYLASKSTWKNSLANSYTWDFTITYSSSSYFANIDQVKFEFEVS